MMIDDENANVPDSGSENHQGQGFDSESETAPAATVYEITVQEDLRPFLETEFADYTVTEGLLLLLVLILFISALARVVRRCFSWLL